MVCIVFIFAVEVPVEASVLSNLRRNRGAFLFGGVLDSTGTYRPSFDADPEKASLEIWYLAEHWSGILFPEAVSSLLSCSKRGAG